MPGIPVYNKCNNNCLMCTNSDQSKKMAGKNFTLEHILGRIHRFQGGKEEFKDNFRDYFALTGGEPTINPQTTGIIKAINKLFPGKPVMCLTNGRMFAYESYAKDFLSTCKELDLVIPVHAPNAKVHDSITQIRGSFVQTLRGLENIFKLKQQEQAVEIRIVIHALNYKLIGKIAEFIRLSFPKVSRLVFIFFEIEGQAIKNLKALKVTHSKVKPYLNTIFDYAKDFEIKLYHFPLCTVPAKFYPYVWRTLPKDELSFPKRCSVCDLKEFCLGVHENYLKYIGDADFKPKKISFEIIRGESWHHPIKGIKGARLALSRC